MEPHRNFLIYFVAGNSGLSTGTGKSQLGLCTQVFPGRVLLDAHGNK